MAGGRKGRGDEARKKRRASRSKSQRKPSKAQRREGNGVNPPPFRLLPPPIKPAKDSGEYRHLVLANGLKVLLISTPEGESWDPAWTLKFPSFLANNEVVGEGLNSLPKLPSYLPVNYPSLNCGGGRDDCCSRALGRGHQPQCCLLVTVGSGSFSDPPEFQGLAHFVEHLVHHGTNSFPGEDSFSNFIEECDGGTNAFTDKTVTNYHAMMGSTKETLLELCKRYASMLTEPLFTLDAVTREIESVDNEYFLRKVGHGFRQNHLLHVATIPNAAHPMRKFSIGSKEGLMNPEVLNSNVLLKDASHRFIKTHYYAENMSLVIQAPHDLDFLQRSVVESFSQIPQKSQFPQEAKLRGQVLPYSTRLFNRLITAKSSNMDGHQLFLAWTLPPEIWKNYKSHVLPYLYSILGHDAPGGLADYLRNKGFIITLDILKEGGTIQNDYATVFQIVFILTQLGRDSIDEVLEATFSYIKLHQTKGPQRSIYNQIKAAQKIQLDKMEMEKSVNQFIRISVQMLTCDPVDVIVGDATPRGAFNTTKISECLVQLTPDRANYFLFTSDPSTSHYMMENVYGTNYVVQDLSPEMLERFREVEIFPEFSLAPPPNPFLNECEEESDDEELITRDSFRDSAKVKFGCYPSVRMASKQVYFNLHAVLGISRAEAYVNRHIFDIMTAMLKLEIFPRLFHQVDVGFQGGIQYFGGTVCFTGSGLCGRSIVERFVAMLQGFENFPQNTNEETFTMAKEAVLQQYFLIAAQQLPCTMDLSLRLKHMDYLTAIEAHDRLVGLTFTAFSEFVQNCKQEIMFLFHCSGSLRRRDLRLLSDQLENFACRPFSDRTQCHLVNYPYTPPKKIPIGEKCLRLRSLVSDERVFVVANKYQMSQRSHEMDVMTLLIYVMLRNKIVFQLRTIEQLGYAIHAQLTLDPDFSGFTVSVCAHLDKHTVCYVDSRIEDFLEKFYQFELTEDKVGAAISLTGIISSTKAIRDHYKKYLLSGRGSQKSKLSIQIVPSSDQGDCRCPHRQNESSSSRCSKWLPPFTRIGNQGVEVAFAGPREPQNPSSYFITSIDEYHRSL